MATASGSGGDAIRQEGGVTLGLRRVTDNDDDLVRVVIDASYDAFTAHAQGGGYRGGAPLRVSRPLDVVLRPEDVGDVMAKREGLAREWQSGDPIFDDRVYVVAPPGSDAFLDRALGPDGRGAVIELFDLGFHEIGVDVARRVEAAIAAGKLEGEPGRAARAVAAFDRLGRALPPLVHDPSIARPRAPLRGLTMFLGAFGAFGWATNVGYVGLVGIVVRAALGRTHDAPAEVSTLGVALPVALGVVAGLVGASMYGRLVGRLAAGTADAHRVAGRAKLASFAGISVLTFTALFAAYLATVR